MCYRLVFVAFWYWIEVRKISRPRTEQTVGERVNKSLPNSNSRDKSPSAAWVPRGTQQTACGSVGVLRVLGTQHRFWQAVEREKEQKSVQIKPAIGRASTDGRRRNIKASHLQRSSLKKCLGSRNQEENASPTAEAVPESVRSGETSRQWWSVLLWDDKRNLQQLRVSFFERCCLTPVISEDSEKRNSASCFLFASENLGWNT